MNIAQTLARVKICGVKDEATALFAAAQGADLLGFVFAPSKRQITPAQATPIIASLKQRHRVAPAAVGLFVNEAPPLMNEIARQTGLDIIQLSGDEAPDASLLALLGLPVIRILRVPVGAAVADVRAQIDAWHSAAREAGDGVRGPWGSRLLIGLDAYHPGLYGGTGQSADHALAATLAAEYPLLLAGGLSPTNVGAAIGHVKPWAVDVSSGVEIAGVKSLDLIQSFIAATRATN